MKRQSLASGTDGPVQRLAFWLFRWLIKQRYTLALVFIVSLLLGLMLGVIVGINLQAAKTDTPFTVIKLGVVLIGILGLLTALGFFLNGSE
jgi:hypothetical protein